MKNSQKNSDAGMYNCCIFLDLTKAFDTVNHDVLLHEIKNFYGFQGLAIKLIQSYLSNRKQYTKMENCKSDLTKIEYGVPHGFFLGRYFFFCISMVFLWLVNLTLFCLLMTLSWPCQTTTFLNYKTK